jgi:shikimate kinase/shikimate kinase/3-dehydroquinate synthase
MESKGNIVFLGMMGSGKTTIGKLFSKKLNLEFFDTDYQIENKLNMSISKVFNFKGEKFFREIEEKITLNLLKKKKIILALGGGAFMNKNIRKEILNNHTSFWLDLDNETIIDRINKSTKRPLALNSTKAELLDMLKKRSYFYSKALYKVNCNNLTKIEIVKKVMKIYENN